MTDFCIRTGKFFALAVALVVFACGGGDGNNIDGGLGNIDAPGLPDSAQCNPGDVRSSQNIYFGTPLPTYVPLRPGQVLAVGMMSQGCSGTLIAPTWALTAKHCEVTMSQRFCIGTQANNPNICITLARVINNPNVDMTLLELTQDARNLLPAVEPIPIMTETMGQAWVGRKAEIAGYGQQETNVSGEREFSAEDMISITQEFITVDGLGERGACFGDSGGPLLVIASDTSVRVAGDLTGGDSSCVDQDNYTRVDTQLAWIESFTGPTQGGDGSCGLITSVGRCFSQGTLASWCGSNDMLASEQCTGASTCGWDDSAQGYRCITGVDPCGGVDEFGTCDGEVARWCQNGQPKMRDCRACGSTDICGSDAMNGVGCVSDPCMGLDYLGRCNGNVAEWCDSGQFASEDCSLTNTTCQYINNQIGYYCQ